MHPLTAKGALYQFMVRKPVRRYANNHQYISPKSASYKRHLILLQGAVYLIFLQIVKPVNSTCKYPTCQLNLPILQAVNSTLRHFSCRYVSSDSKPLIFRSCYPVSKICSTSEIPCFQAFSVHLLLDF